MKTLCLLYFAFVASKACGAQGAAPLVWVPTQSAPEAKDYVGAKSCASCHRKEAKSATVSQMGRSILLPNTKYPDQGMLTLTRGPWTYTLRREGEASLTVEDGKQQITAPIFAIIGAGHYFQSYLLRYKGVPYRAAVDVVTAPGRLELDQEADPPNSLESALGRHHSEKYVRTCLGCHSPASVTADDIDLIRRPLGNTCEVCHGPGARHAALERTGASGPEEIFNPAHLSAADEADFCGQCHTTAAAMQAQHAKGTGSVISEPYRLETSRCWKPDDRRIRCTACHDPHRPIVRETAAYDPQCKACHSVSKAATGQRNAAVMCPVGKHDCASCHMPTVTVPDTPIVYADHRIRIVGSNTPFPE